MPADPVPADRGPVVGVLVCDHVLPELRDAAGGDYPEVYAGFLRRADPHLAVRTYDAVDGELPADPDECDAWILTGARYDAFGEERWLVELRALLVELHAAGRRTVGICFGHQVLAQALGGRVERAEGWRAGPHRLELDATPWYPATTADLHAMHRDEVATLPPGARPAGRGTTAEHAAFLLDEHVLGIQDHPEFTDAYVLALAESRLDRFGEDLVVDVRQRVAARENGGPRLARPIVDFLLDRRSSWSGST